MNINFIFEPISNFRICAISDNYCISPYIVYNMDRACENTQKLISKLTF